MALWLRHLNMKKSEVSPTAAAFHVYKSFWSVLRSQALETHQLGFPDLNGRTSCWTGPSRKPSPEPCWTSPGSAPKPPRPSPEPCWTWPGSAQNLPDLLRNFFRNPVEPDLALHQSPLLNLTWLCTKASQTFTWAFFGTLLNLTWLCTKASRTFFGTLLNGTFSGTLSWLCSLPDLHRNLLRHPLELDPALHQSLPDLLRNLDWALHQSLPNLLRNLLRNPVELDLALHQSLPQPGTLLHQILPDRNLLRNPVEPNLALHQSLHDLHCWAWLGFALEPPRPSPAPCWTWPGCAPKPPGTFSGTLLCTKASQTFTGTFSGTLLNLTRACTSAHRSYSGLKTPLALAVGEKASFQLSKTRAFASTHASN